MAKEQGILALHHALQPRVPVSGREVPITSGCKKKKAGIEAEEDENFWIPSQFLFKDPCMDSLRLTLSHLQS